MAVFNARSCDVANSKFQIITIDNYETVDDHIEYLIRVSLSGTSWVIKRRYNEFYEFDRKRFAKLKQSFLPAKKVLGNRSDKFLDARRSELENYLRTVLEFDVELQIAKNEYCLSRPFAEFMRFHELESHSIVEGLCEKFFEQGETILQADQCHEMNPLQLWAITERLKLAEPTCSGSHGKFDLGHLVDFLHRLPYLKISAKLATVADSNVNMRKLSCSVDMFRSVRRLKIYDYDCSKIIGVERFRKSVEYLRISRSLRSLKYFFAPDQILDPKSGFDDNDNPLPQFCFSSLKHVDLSNNGITALDSSLKFLPNLVVLSLSDNQICEMNFIDCLSSLEDLDLSNNRFSSMPDLNKKMGNVKSLNLRGNRISSLVGFEKCFSLQLLDLRENALKQPSDIWSLSGLPCLATLLLKGNPVESSIEYRTRVLETFGDRAKEVRLDGKIPSSREMDTVQVRLAMKKARLDRERMLQRATEEISKQLDPISYPSSTSL